MMWGVPLQKWPYPFLELLLTQWRYFFLYILIVTFKTNVLYYYGHGNLYLDRRAMGHILKQQSSNTLFNMDKASFVAMNWI